MGKYIYCLLFILVSKAYGQEYASSLIADSLTVNADVIKRNEIISVTIKSISKAVVKHKYAVTILNERGDEYATYTNGYTKFISLSDISVKLFD